MDEWREVPGFEGRYDVSIAGQVRSWMRSGPGGENAPRKVVPSPVAPRTTESGHLRVNLVRYVGGVREVKSLFVHRLVLLAFVGPCPPHKEACHNDGNPTNNRLGNLRWDTRWGNKRDTNRHGRQPKGAQVHSAKLTEHDVRAIRVMDRNPDLRRADIAARFGISGGTLSHIINRKTWKHVP